MKPLVFALLLVAANSSTDATRLPEMRQGPASYYICPKDESMLRVPHANHPGTFKCPVDGTPMKPAIGRQSAIFLLK